MNGVRGWVIAAVVFAGAFLVWNVLAGSLSALLLLFMAVLLSAGLRPIVDRMHRRMPFGAAVAVAFGVLIVVIALIGFVLVQPLGAELVKLIQAIPSYAASLQQQFGVFQRYLKEDQMARQLASVFATSAGTVVSAIGPYILGGPRLVATLIGDTLLIVLLAIGWTLSADELARFVLGLIAPRARGDWQETFADIHLRLSAYVQGVVLNGTIVGVVMCASLAVLGVPYALLLGFIAAIFQAIPMLGAVLSGPIILIVVLATNGWERMLIALAIFVVVQMIDQNVLSPVIFGQSVRLSFLLIILATVIGGTLLGITGAFLAVPAAAALQVLVVRIIAPAISRANGAGTSGDASK